MRMPSVDMSRVMRCVFVRVRSICVVLLMQQDRVYPFSVNAGSDGGFDMLQFVGRKPATVIVCFSTELRTMNFSLCSVSLKPARLSGLFRC